MARQPIAPARTSGLNVYFPPVSPTYHYTCSVSMNKAPLQVSSSMGLYFVLLLASCMLLQVHLESDRPSTCPENNGPASLAMWQSISSIRTSDRHQSRVYPRAQIWMDDTNLNSSTEADLANQVGRSNGLLANAFTT